MDPTDTIDSALWLRSFHSAPGAPVRLVCFPHAGGSASYFWPFSAVLASAVEVQAVQYPGRQDRHNEPLVDNLDELADVVTRALDEYDDMPTAFFGHSMGATLAYEVARRWSLRGRAPVCLFASGRRAPSLRPPVPVPMMSDNDALAELKRLNGTDSRLMDDQEMLRLVLPVIRNDFRAAESYRFVPGTDLSCPIITLRGADDPRVFAADADHWRYHTTGPFSSYTFDGGHFYTDTRYKEVAQLVEGELARLLQVAGE